MIKEKINPSIRLDEVTLMRCILALLIVFMHSFTCYNGSWAKPTDYVDIPLYKWLTRITFAFTLEAFVFVSGYIMAFQHVTLKKRVTNVNYFINKLKRLILPSIVFSLFYFIIFYTYNGPGNMIYNIINGCGHMWYLPMLLGCFLGSMFLLQIRVSQGWKLILLVLLNFFTIITLPLRISDASTFIVYFYSGYLCYLHKEKIKKILNLRLLSFMWLIFLISFILCRPIRDILVVNDSQSNIVKFCVYVGNNISQFVYVTTGLIAFYCTVLYYVQRHEIKPFVIKLSAYCFGIYLLHQFILQLMYYRTSLPIIVGPYLLPWVGFICTLPISIVASRLILKTKIGNFLIG